VMAPRKRGTQKSAPSRGAFFIWGPVWDFKNAFLPKSTYAKLSKSACNADDASGISR